MGSTSPIAACIVLLGTPDYPELRNTPSMTCRRRASRQGRPRVASSSGAPGHTRPARAAQTQSSTRLLRGTVGGSWKELQARLPPTSADHIRPPPQLTPPIRTARIQSTPRGRRVKRRRVSGAKPRSFAAAAGIRQPHRCPAAPAASAMQVSARRGRHGADELPPARGGAQVPGLRALAHCAPVATGSTH